MLICKQEITQKLVYFFQEMVVGMTNKSFLKSLLMKHSRLFGKLQADLQIIKDIIRFIGGYQNMIMNQKFLIQAENLDNIRLLIEKTIL